MAKETTLEERCLSVGSLLMDSLDLTLQDLRSDLTRQQREVGEWKNIITRIESGRSVGWHYCLLENRLFKQKTIYGRSYLRLCVPPAFRNLILKSCHDDPVSGHLGIHRTLTKIASRFVWDSMANDVTRYVKSWVGLDAKH